MIRVLLVDDERPARDRLRDLLAAFEDVEVAGDAADGDEALQQISTLRPDLVFLDIQMPGRSGLEVAASLPSPRPRVIFCTAFDKHAVEAFEVHAVDYLLKPVSRSRLAEAMDQVRQSPGISDSVLEKLVAELEVAREVQTRLFPQTLPPMLTLDYTGTWKAAHQLGGDYYDFLQLGEDQLYIALGDISGKSISGALLMAGLQALMRSQAPLRGASVGELLGDINRLMCASTDSNRYATFFCGLYNDGRRTLTYVNAGHNSPMLFRRKNSPATQSAGGIEAGLNANPVIRDLSSHTILRLETGGTVVGVFQHASYQQETVQMQPGDVLVIFSDGVTEARSIREEEFGEVRLSELVVANDKLPAAALAHLVFAEIGKFVGNSPPHDDMTLVVAKVM